MKSRIRHTAAALVLAVVLFLPTVALAAPQSHVYDGPIVRIIKKIQKLFGVTTNFDSPVPPLPAGPPKP